jgi:hypothetical protein
MGIGRELARASRGEFVASPALFRFEFTLDLADYAAMMRSTVRRVQRAVRWPMVIFLVAYLLIVAVPDGENSSVLDRAGEWWGFLVLPAFFYLLVPLASRRAARKRWIAAPALQERLIYEFSDLGLSMSGESYQQSCHWKNFVSAELAGPVILILTAANVVYIIPVRALGREEQVLEFKTFLRGKAPDCRRLS